MIELTGYQIGTQLHAGQTSLVYRAVRLLDGVPVVVKFLRNEFPTAQESARYQREFAVAGSLKLKGCVRILAMEIAQHRSVLIYEDDGSVSLRRLYAGRALDTLRWLHIAIESCKCLQELHAHKLVHRDINPSNVLINSQTLIVKLTDLELAGPASSTDETQERAFGTVAYMAPEQSGRIRAAIDARSDLYSFGAMIFELATGRSVFIGSDDLSLMHAHLALQPESPAALNPDFPAILAKIVLRLLAKSPSDRYQSARGLLNDLSRVQALLAGKIALAAIDFELGQLDHADALASAEVPYGQDSARADLEAQIARTQRDGTRALISISGLAGSGKSLLVERFGGSYSGSVFFGRCERLDRSVPYSGLVSALHPVAQRWLGLEQSALESLKRKLMTALGVNAAVLLPLMPDLPKLLGKLPPVLPLGAGAEQARFQLAVRAFFQVCTQHFQPFLIALDDFHWADPATLALLEKLLTSDLQGWCLITTERAEVQGADLSAWRDRIKTTGLQVLEIDLVSAEGLRARGLQNLDSACAERLDQASSAYLRAIAHAQAQRQSLLQAQATQYLAELFQKRGHSFASGLSRDAEQLYRRAGAMAKVGDASAAATRVGTRTAVLPSETLRSHR